MHTSIEFPNIGIHLESVGNHITIFGFDIAYYGMIIGAGILAGIFIAAWEAKRTGQKPDDYYDLAIYAVIFSIIGARIYYVVFSWDMYKDNLLSIFNIRQGGLAIYGGVIAAVITVTVFAKIKHLSAPLLMDTAGLGLVAGQMIGRWGNFFNREAFGEYTDSLFAMRLPEAAVRPHEITELIAAHASEGAIQVHPTFLYECLWNLMVVAAMLVIWKYKQFEGEIGLVYLGGYGLGRSWIEGFRTDQLHLPGTQIPVSQLLAVVLVIFSVVAYVYVMRKKKREDKETE